MQILWILSLKYIQVVLLTKLSGFELLHLNFILKMYVKTNWIPGFTHLIVKRVSLNGLALLKSSNITAEFDLAARIIEGCIFRSKRAFYPGCKHPYSRNTLVFIFCVVFFKAPNFFL